MPVIIFNFDDVRAIRQLAAQQPGRHQPPPASPSAWPRVPARRAGARHRPELGACACHTGPRGPLPVHHTRPGGGARGAGGGRGGGARGGGGGGRQQRQQRRRPGQPRDAGPGPARAVQLQCGRRTSSSSTSSSSSSSSQRSGGCHPHPHRRPPRLPSRAAAAVRPWPRYFHGRHRTAGAAAGPHARGRAPLAGCHRARRPGAQRLHGV